MGWEVIEATYPGAPHKLRHVVAQDDVAEHDLGVVCDGDDYKSACNCVNYVNEDGTVVHHSFDGREQFEPDSDIRRKPS